MKTADEKWAIVDTWRGARFTSGRKDWADKTAREARRISDIGMETMTNVYVVLTSLLTAEAAAFPLHASVRDCDEDHVKSGRAAARMRGQTP